MESSSAERFATVSREFGDSLTFDIEVDAAVDVTVLLIFPTDI